MSDYQYLVLALNIRVFSQKFNADGGRLPFTRAQKVKFVSWLGLGHLWILLEDSMVVSFHPWTDWGLNICHNSFYVGKYVKKVEGFLGNETLIPRT